MDHDTPLKEIEEKLNKLKVDLEVINLWGDYDAPMKRKEIQAKIKELTRLKENYDTRSDQAKD
jgi:hypothetical protein